MPYCPNCGTQVEPGDAFCRECGADLDGHSGGENPSSKRESPPGQPGRQPGAQQNAGQHPRRETGGSPSEQPRASGSSPQSQRDPRSQPPSGDTNGISRRGLLATGGIGLVALGGAGWYLLSSTSGTGGERLRPPPLDQMQVRLVDGRAPSAGLTSATIPLVISVTNPTQRPIPDMSGDFDIYINGVRVGSDEVVINRLEPGETTTTTLNVIVKYGQTAQAVVDAIKSGSFQVRVRGTLNAGSASRSVSLSTQVG